MPDMTDPEFAQIDWRTLDEPTYERYLDGVPDNQGRTLTQAQKDRARKAHDWTTGDLNRILNIGADSLVGNAPVTKWGRLWWFMYFWKEAKSGKSRGDAAELGYAGRGNSINDNLAYLFGLLFVKPAPGNVDALSPRIPFENVPDNRMQTCLKMLLEIGFRKILLDVEQGQVSDAAFTWKQYCMLKEKVRLEIAWRSEDRTALDIMNKGGFEPQAHDESWATYTNMRAEWHPFSQESVRGYLWYRLGQNDNCKYTVTSLAKDVRVALGFPKFDTDNFPNMPRTDPNAMLPQQRATCTKDGVPLIGEVTLEGGGHTEVRFLAVTKTTVAQVILEKYIFDTQQAQESYQPGSGFRELGVGKVPMRNIVGLFSFYRVHHGITEPDGFTALIDRPGCTPIEAKHLLKFSASQMEAEQLAAVLAPLYQQTLAMGPVASAWGPTGYANPGRALTLADGLTAARVRQIRINNNVVWAG